MNAGKIAPRYDRTLVGYAFRAPFSVAPDRTVNALPPAAAALRKANPAPKPVPSAFSADDIIPPTFYAGERFGAYQIISRLGNGGMASVYLASHPEKGQVALKISSLAAERFLKTEGDILSELAGAKYGITSILDRGKINGKPYLALEYKSGKTLTELLSKGPLSIPQALDIISQVCFGLNYLHSQKILHGDIKPGNIIVADDGKVNIIDFGTAQKFPTARTDSVVGSPGWESPEQKKGDSMGQASDIAQVGYLMFKMLTGQKPFKHPDDVLDTEPSLPLSFPLELWQMHNRMIRTNPDERYQSIEEVQAEIEAYRAAA